MKKLFVLSAIVIAACSIFAINYWVTASLGTVDVSGGASAVILNYTVTLGPGEHYTDFMVHVNNAPDFSGSNNLTRKISNGSSITVDLTGFIGSTAFWRLEDLAGNSIIGIYYGTFEVP